MSAAAGGGGIDRRLVVVLAVACGAAVADLYYAQPLLQTIARALHCGSGTAGLVVTASQVGYAAGLALVVPLGDLANRRRLVPLVLAGTAAALAASAAAPAIAVLVLLALPIGLGSVAAQILVPLAAELASDEQRGRVVGTVMSGLLLGILLARTLSGLVAGAAGWRVVYLAGAGIALLLAAVLGRVLPAEGERPALRYGDLLRSTAVLLGREPVLRRRAGFGALAFAAFSVLWTTIAFLLAGPPYRYGDTVIGLFGLAGAAGALCANLAGRLADRDRTPLTTAVFAGCILASFLPLWLGRHSLGWLIAGVVLLDVGVQGLHITNQSLVYRLPAGARSRVTSVYMVCYFAGGAAGSALAGAVYGARGWAGTCVLGAAIGAAATIGAALDRLVPARRAAPAAAAEPAAGG